MLNLEWEVVQEGVSVLHLKGPLTIETAAEFKQALLTGLTDYEQIFLDVHGLEEIDFFGVQLLCSAHRTFTSRRKLLTWKEGMPQQLVALVKQTGFARKQGCNLCPDGIDCMWLFEKPSINQLDKEQTPC